jgi:hypothetical protein
MKKREDAEGGSKGENGKEYIECDEEYETKDNKREKKENC